MSAHFAIPATTFVLRALIEARLKVAYTGFTAPKVSIEPPPRPAAPPATGATAETSGLHLYMHHASPNGTWRNMYDPHIDGAGKRYRKAPLVLDLHYLLAVQGGDLEREALLGVAMSALHRNGVVPRGMIQQILGAIAVPASPTKLMERLTTEPLHDPDNQPESITVSQETYDIDMSTKVWSALQSPMRPCAYYLVTTVFLDTGETFPAPLPVETVAITGRPVASPSIPAEEDVIVVGTPLP